MAFEKRFVSHRGITVIQKLDPSLRRHRLGKVGMVLAGGAISGGAFKAGGLRALDETFLRRRTPGQATAKSFGLSDLDVFVGLSAGSLLAAVLAAGFSTDEVFRVVHGSSDSFEPFQPWHFMRPNLREALPRLASFLGHEHEVLTNWVSGATDWRTGEPFSLRRTLGKMASAAIRLVPSGLFDPLAIEEYLKRNFARAGVPDDFAEAYRRTHRELYLSATDLDRGEMVVFGHDEPMGKVPISRAVAASCALPIWYRPLRIDNPNAGQPGEPDRLDLVDGSLLRTANVRLPIEKGCELVICYNPLTRIRYDRAGRALFDQGMPTVISQSARTIIGSRLDTAKELVFREEGVQADVVFIEPAEDDYDFFRINPLDFWAREEASQHGYDAVTRAVEANYGILAEVFATHGIELRSSRGDPWPTTRLQPTPSGLRRSRG